MSRVLAVSGAIVGLVYGIGSLIDGNVDGSFIGYLFTYACINNYQLQEIRNAQKESVHKV